MNEAAKRGGNRRRNVKSPTLRLAAVAALTIVIVALTDAIASANAQGNGPAIEVAATISAESPTQVSFPIRVGPVASIPNNSFVRVRGMPPMAALSDGYSIASGSWAVPLRALADLKIILPVGLEGRSTVSVSLVALDGSVVVEVKTTLIVNARPPLSAQPLSNPSVRVRDADAPPAPAKPSERRELPRFPAPTKLADDRERALKLMQKGDEQLAQGLVAPARLLYERAVDLGLARAAMALAATYDAAELTTPHLRGISPDADEAKRWYERARQLGASDAEQRLRRLGAN